jgi:hypothetical protein
VQALPRAGGQKVPDDHDPARHFAPQGLEKRDDVVRVDGVILAAAGELACGPDGVDGREVVAGAPPPWHRRLAHRGVGADHAGQGIEARFALEGEGLLRRLRPFWRAGEVSSSIGPIKSIRKNLPTIG